VAQKEWDIFCFDFEEQKIGLLPLDLLFKCVLGYYAMYILSN
jgi:hypothetical protein